MTARWIGEIKGKEAGKTAFVLGNGWSMNFFDAAEMKRHGILIGCNHSFTRYPLDYLIWQDTSVTEDCIRAKAPTIKVFPQGKVKRVKNQEAIDWESTFVFGYTRRLGKTDDDALEAMNSGGLALQLAIHLGVSTAILVGCDCEIMQANPVGPKGHNTFRSNIFKDKIALKLTAARSKANLEMVDGRYTNGHLKSFAKKFEELYRRHKADVDIFKLGDFGIVQIPPIDWIDFHSEQHPGKRRIGVGIAAK